MPDNPLVNIHALLSSKVSGVPPLDDFVKSLDNPKALKAIHDILGQQTEGLPRLDEFTDKVGHWRKNFIQAKYAEKRPPDEVRDGVPHYTFEQDPGPPTREGSTPHTQITYLPGRDVAADRLPPSTDVSERRKESALRAESARRAGTESLAAQVPSITKEAPRVAEFRSNVARMKQEETELLQQLPFTSPIFLGVEGLHKIATGATRVFNALPKGGAIYKSDTIDELSLGAADVVLGGMELAISPFLLQPGIMAFNTAVQAVGKYYEPAVKYLEFPFQAVTAAHKFGADLFDYSDQPSELTEKLLKIGDNLVGFIAIGAAMKGMKAGETINWKRAKHGGVEYEIIRDGNITYEGTITAKSLDTEKFIPNKKVVEAIHANPEGGTATYRPEGFVRRIVDPYYDEARRIARKIIGTEKLTDVEMRTLTEAAEQVKLEGLIDEAQAEYFVRTAAEHQRRADAIIERRNRASDKAYGAEFLPERFLFGPDNKLNHEKLQSISNPEHLDYLRKFYKDDPDVVVQIENRLREVDPGQVNIEVQEQGVRAGEVRRELLQEKRIELEAEKAAEVERMMRRAEERLGRDEGVEPSREAPQVVAPAEGEKLPSVLTSPEGEKIPAGEVREARAGETKGEVNPFEGQGKLDPKITGWMERVRQRLILSGEDPAVVANINLEGLRVRAKEIGLEEPKAPVPATAVAPPQIRPAVESTMPPVPEIVQSFLSAGTFKGGPVTAAKYMLNQAEGLAKGVAEMLETFIKDATVHLKKKYVDFRGKAEVIRRLETGGATAEEAGETYRWLQHVADEGELESVVQNLARKIYRRLRPGEYERAQAKLDADPNVKDPHATGAMEVVRLTAQELQSRLELGNADVAPVKRVGGGPIDPNKFAIVAGIPGLLTPPDDKNRGFLDRIIYALSLSMAAVTVSRTVKYGGKTYWNAAMVAEKFRQWGLNMSIRDVAHDTRAGMFDDYMMFETGKGNLVEPLYNPGSARRAFELIKDIHEQPPEKLAEKHALNNVLLKHYSSFRGEEGNQFLTVVDPKFAGTGHAGAEARRYPERQQYGTITSYFYPNGIKPEAMFRHAQLYRGVGNGIYDLTKDPLHLVDRSKKLRINADDITKLEVAVKKAGFNGYTDGSKVALFNPIEVVAAIRKGKKFKVEQQEGAALGASPYVGKTFTDPDRLIAQFNKTQMRRYTEEVNVVLDKYGLTPKRVVNASGVWREGGKYVYEPSKRIELSETDLRVDAIAAELGWAKDQNAVYIFKHNPMGVDTEYAIHFKDTRSAFESSQQLERFGIGGGALAIDESILYIGDQGNQLGKHIRQFFLDAQARGVAVRGRKSRGTARFLGKDEYQSTLDEYRGRSVRDLSAGRIGDYVYAKASDDYAVEGLGRLNRDILSAAASVKPGTSNAKAYQGSAVLARGITDFEAWAEEMASLGIRDKESLQQLYAQSYTIFDSFLKRSLLRIPSTKRMLELFHKGEAGSEWYKSAADDLYEEFGPMYSTMAGFLASTSANTSVAGNVTLALKAYRQFIEGKPFSGFMPAHLGNLYREASGLPLSGRKVSNFRENLTGNDRAVTVDVWMSRIFGFPDEGLNDARYEFISDVVTQLADAQKISPAEYQARLWVGIKKEMPRRGDTFQPITKILQERLRQGELFEPNWWKNFAENHKSDALMLVAGLGSMFQKDKDENILTASFGGLDVLAKLGAIALAVWGGGKLIKGLRDRYAGGALAVYRSMKDKPTLSEFERRMNIMFGDTPMKNVDDYYNMSATFNRRYDVHGYGDLVKGIAESIKARVESGELPKEEMYRELKLRVQEEFTNSPTFTHLSRADFDLYSRYAYQEIRRTLRETETPPKSAIEMHARDLAEQMERELAQLEAVASTGTYQPKEVRPSLALGASPPQSSVINEKIVELLKERFVAYGRNLKIIRAQALATGDVHTAADVELALVRMQDISKEFKTARAVWGRTGHVLQRAIRDAEEALGSLDNARIVRKRMAPLDQLVRDIGDSLKKLVGKEGSDRTPEMKIRNAVNYARLNLFTMFTWSLDLFTNAVSAATHTAKDVVLDTIDLTKGQDFTRTKGLIQSIWLQSRGLGRAVVKRSGQEFYRLPDSIELELGATVGGEFIASMTEAKIGKLPVDYLIAPHIRAKGAIDRIFGRTFTLAELISQARRAANEKGMSGYARQEFIQDYIGAQSPRTAGGMEAIRIGKEVKFNRDLSHFEERLASSVGIQLLVSAFPRWGFQFGRWMGEMVGLNFRLFGKIKNGTATADDMIEAIIKATTGVSGLYYLSSTMYDHIDFNTMMYMREDGNPVRISGRSPLPDALVLIAAIRGDWEKVQAGMQYTSFPFSQAGTDQQGLLGAFFGLLNQKASHEITAEKFVEEFDGLLNRLLPGQSVLNFTNSMLEYGVTGEAPVRKGLGANVPGFSQAFTDAAINPTTGKPLSRLQMIPGTDVEFPTTGGTALPGGVIVMNPVEKEFMRHGIGTFRPRRTALPGYIATDVPEELRERYEIYAGEYTDALVGPLVMHPAYQGALFDDQTEMLAGYKAQAMELAKLRLQAESGKLIPESYETFRQKLLPTEIRKKRMAQLKYYGITPPEE